MTSAACATSRSRSDGVGCGGVGFDGPDAIGMDVDLHLHTQRRAWQAMGTDAEVLITGYLASSDPQASAPFNELADLAVQRVELLESSWSRFRRDSELSELNRHAGRGPFAASADLMELIERMQDAWRWTAGACDANVHDAMSSLGYDRDFAMIQGPHGREETRTLTPAQWQVNEATMGDVVVDRVAGTVHLPHGMRLDPGAIGKGLAADIVCRELAAAGAAGALVNLGGDISAVGLGAPDQGWRIAVLDERIAPEAKDRQHCALTIDHGPFGVATSTTLRRRWSVGGRTVHHVLDPRTGQPVDSDLVQVTVVAPTGWQAEAAATAAMILGAEQGPNWLAQRELFACVLTSQSSRIVRGERNVHVDS